MPAPPRPAARRGRGSRSSRGGSRRRRSADRSAARPGRHAARDRASLIRSLPRSSTASRRRDEDRVRLTREAERKKPWCERVSQAESGAEPTGAAATAPKHVHARPAARAADGPDGNLLQAEDVRPIGRRELDHAAEEPGPSRRLSVRRGRRSRSAREAWRSLPGRGYG